MVSKNKLQHKFNWRYFGQCSSAYGLSRFSLGNQVVKHFLEEQNLSWNGECRWWKIWPWKIWINCKSCVFIVSFLDNTQSLSGRCMFSVASLMSISAKFQSCEKLCFASSFQRFCFDIRSTVLPKLPRFQFWHLCRCYSCSVASLAVLLLDLAVFSHC